MMRGVITEKDLRILSDAVRGIVRNKDLATAMQALKGIGEGVRPTLPSLLDSMEAEYGTLYRYAWKNNEKRATMHNRLCIVIARGKQNSAMIEFIDNGQREIVSRNALRRMRKPT
jgi:hypothetical protein